MAPADSSPIAALGATGPQDVAVAGALFGRDVPAPGAIAETFGEARGKPARFEPIAIAAPGDDARAMFECFSHPPAPEVEFAGVGAPTDFRSFVDRLPLTG